VRELAYKLLFRAVLLSPACGPPIADKHSECLEAEDLTVRRSAICKAAEMSMIFAPAAERVLLLLFRLARRGDGAASAELLRATSSGLDFHCMQSK
jgi:hypothetical protein